VLAPGIEKPCANARLAGVIQNKICLGAASNEFDDGRQLRMFTAQIATQSGCRQLFDTGNELRPGAEIERLMFDVMANAAHEWMLPQLSDGSGGLRAGIHRDVCDDRYNATILRGELFNPLHFLEPRRTAFDEDDFIGEIFACLSV
jgi:hypothetical protein